MDINVEITKLSIEKSDIVVVRLLNDQPVPPQMRDALQRITENFEEKNGWRPLIISCTKDIEWSKLTNDQLNSVGLQRLPDVEEPLAPITPLAAPVSPEKMKEWAAALRKVQTVPNTFTADDAKAPKNPELLRKD